MISNLQEFALIADKYWFNFQRVGNHRSYGRIQCKPKDPPIIVANDRTMEMKRKTLNIVHTNWIIRPFSRKWSRMSSGISGLVGEKSQHFVKREATRNKNPNHRKNEVIRSEALPRKFERPARSHWPSEDRWISKWKMGVTGFNKTNGC
jgi:hypothetical protein